MPSSVITSSHEIGLGFPKTLMGKPGDREEHVQAEEGVVLPPVRRYLKLLESERGQERIFQEVSEPAPT